MTHRTVRPACTPGIPLPNFEPEHRPDGGGCSSPQPRTSSLTTLDSGRAENPLLPPTWRLGQQHPRGRESNIDEVFVGLNTLMAEPMRKDSSTRGGRSTRPRFSAKPSKREAAGDGHVAQRERVNRMGSFKAPPLRHVAQTGPYFHNGGKLTLRQVVDFYMRGGDFPLTNSPHRDFLIVNGLIEDEALGGVDPVTGQPEFSGARKEEIIVSVVDSS